MILSSDCCVVYQLGYAMESYTSYYYCGGGGGGGGGGVGDIPQQHKSSCIRFFCFTFNEIYFFKYRTSYRLVTVQVSECCDGYSGVEGSCIGNLLLLFSIHTEQVPMNVTPAEHLPL